jgi:hypothetical protein
LESLSSKDSFDALTAKYSAKEKLLSDTSKIKDKTAKNIQ